MMTAVHKRGVDLLEDVRPLSRKRSCTRQDVEILSSASSMQADGAGSSSGAVSGVQDILSEMQRAGVIHNDPEALLGPGALSRPLSLWTPDQVAWLAFGELNLLSGRYPELFSQTPLLSYHSFTRTTKPSVFSKMCSVYSISPEDICRGAVRGPIHLRMVLHLLEKVFHDYTDASIVVSSFHTPDWLHEWCRKWGFNSDRRSMVTIYTVQAFPQAGHPLMPMSAPPVRTLLVPSFPSSYGQQRLPL